MATWWPIFARRLLDFVHFFTFTCHGLLNLWLSCKVNEQVGGYAPKSIVPQTIFLQKWVHMLRKGGAAVGLAHAIFVRFLPLFGWLCSEIITGFSTASLGGHAPNFVMCFRNKHGEILIETPNKKVKAYYKLIGETVPASLKIKDFRRRVMLV